MTAEPIEVLLVEDNSREAELVREMLAGSRDAFHVVHAQRLADAARRVQEEPRPHVVLLDLGLPDAQGPEVFASAQAQMPDVPIVILTNVQDEERAAHAVREGAQDYLVKREVDTRLLVRSIRYAVERHRAEQALRESEERYALAVLGANDGIWDWDVPTGNTYFSARWKSMLGYGEDEIGSRIEEWLDRVHAEDIDGLRAALDEHLEGRSGHFEHEHRMYTRDGRLRWVLCRGIAVRDASGRAYRMAGSLTDVTARKEAESKLAHDAMHDSLTGLPNRSLFLDRLGQAIRRMGREEDNQFAVLFFDLDRFKNINDSLGHTVGDELLKSISRRLETSLRPGDTLARLGGDEFAILLHEAEGVGGAIHVAERVHQLLSRQFVIDEHEVYTTASIGIALGSPAYERPGDVLRDADLAMYRAKAAGHARYAVFDSDMHETAVALLKLETELRRAVEREEFVMHYQPIVSLSTGGIRGFEALVRWKHPQRGLVSPEHFVHTAEEMGLIVPIGWWVLRKACTQARLWQNQYPMNPPLSMSVNISGKLFLQPDMMEHLKKILEETGLAPSSLRLEITESALMHHGDSALARLRELRRLGVQLHIDDFGTGYSSLSYLQRFSYDTLKIDRSFVGSIGRTDDAEAIVRTIIVLGEMLGMNVIAEGVETIDQYERLRGMSCPQAQGYWFSRPLEHAAAGALLAAPPPPPQTM